ncbi:MAG TPA: thiamine-phosphate kinase [Gammaproteobacteria bacterium]|nr:thiamine-phosphate kinase [Gammaproteobacteria bacterium]
MDEFALIRRYFDRPGDNARGVSLGIGDDAALLQVPAGHELAVTTDTMVEAVHFPADAPAHGIGYRALATNLSDLAAMGATPAWATLAVTLPGADAAWIEAFSRGFFELADAFDVALVGGDVTRGPLTITVGMYGVVAAGTALRRSGARPGDRIVVTGALGEAAAGLKAWPLADGGGRYLYPQPRVAEGQALRGYASAAIDISDGLLADLGHIIEASGVGAEVAAGQVPLAPTLASFDSATARETALTGGDDYELCFTIEPERLDALRQVWQPEWAELHEIGVISDQRTLRCIAPDGTLWQPDAPGYRHF